MSVFEAIKIRRSIRRFKNKPVEEEKIKKLLESARLSPSTNNNQPWHFILITKKETRESLFAAYPRDWFVEAPAIIVVCAQPQEGWSRQDGEKYWKVDGAIAMQSIMLVAHDLDLGSCCVAAFDAKKVKKVLGNLYLKTYGRGRNKEYSFVKLTGINKKIIEATEIYVSKREKYGLYELTSGKKLTKKELFKQIKEILEDDLE